jgi:hypothetical protein
MNLDKQARADNVCWSHFPGVIERIEAYGDSGELVGRLWRVEIYGFTYHGSYQACVDFAWGVKSGRKERVAA